MPNRKKMNTHSQWTRRGKRYSILRYCSLPTVLYKYIKSRTLTSRDTTILLSIPKSYYVNYCNTEWKKEENVWIWIPSCCTQLSRKWPTRAWLSTNMRVHRWFLLGIKNYPWYDESSWPRELRGECRDACLPVQKEQHLFMYYTFAKRQPVHL